MLNQHYACKTYFEDCFTQSETLCYDDEGDICDYKDELSLNYSPPFTPNSYAPSTPLTQMIFEEQAIENNTTSFNTIISIFLIRIGIILILISIPMYCVNK